MTMEPFSCTIGRMENDDVQLNVELDAQGRPTKTWLERVYLEEKLSTKDIARVTGRSTSGIWYLMKQYGIPLRQPTERIDRAWLEQKYVVERLPVKEIAEQAGAKPDQIRYLVRLYGFPLKRPILREIRPTREWVVQKYIVEGLSSKQICKLTGYSRGGFSTLLESYGIPAKGRSLPKLEISREELYQLHVVEGLTAVRIARRYDCHNSAISRLITQYDLDPGRPLVNIPVEPPLTRDELWKLYWVDQLSIEEIARRYQTSKSTAQRWFKQLDVPARKWNGGEVHRIYTRAYSKEKRFGYEFNAYERERIMKRDGLRCRMPGCHCTDVGRLEVHHIIAIKHGGTNALENGITLCHDCHTSIIRRETQFAPLFQSLLVNPQDLARMQTHYIGETPGKANTEGTSSNNEDAVETARETER